MKDKFIMIGLDDKRSNKIAQVLGNKTCKKIIDFLGDIKEASEKDISDELKSPINTIEYNLKKLLDAGLVEKTKNFFWSKKGKKIAMYKLAKKHIIISPKSSKPNLNALKTILPAILAIAFVFALISIFNQPIDESEVSQEFNKFNSLKELNDFLKENTIEDGRGGILENFAEAAVASTAGTSKSADSSASDYSSTNIQVQGVDEADIIKNDGKYIYTVTNNKVIIVDAYPAQDLEILSEIEFDNNQNIQGIFINKDKLIVFSTSYDTAVYDSKVRCMAIRCVMPPQESKTNIYIYNIKDRADPDLEESISVSGNYHDSRMIEDHVYLVNNQYIYDDGILPAIEQDSEVDIIKANEIYYSPIKDYSFQYTIILAIDIDSGEVSEKVLLTGRAQNIFVSQDNIYTTFTKYARWHYPMEMVEEGSIKEKEKTIINKFSINKQDIEYVATGEVLGHILNQFSMDQYKNNFRIATTVGEVWNSNELSVNNVYVLDEELNLIGELEDLAPGETIYSVRFMGEKAYVVTFKKVDPLFVIDLSNPENPSVLGKLKIPGYSDYLHPIDENHIIGIGKEAVEAQDKNRDFAWYQGIKMAVFDVSDVNNPIELHKVVIGDRGTESEALHNHKAFLFDREKELLVLPITLAEIQGEKTKENQYGEFTFQGAYVYNLNIKDGF